jgi:uncharacterized membrane protein
MRSAATIVAIAALVSACGTNDVPVAGNTVAPETPVTAGWRLGSDQAGTALTLGEGGEARLRIICTRDGRMLVNVPAFAPVGSEERLSFGGSGMVVALVADTAGDARLGGVTASGPIPDTIKAIIIAPMSASYGSQASGPHPAVPDALGGPFTSACGEALTAKRTADSRPTATTSPCHVQDGQLRRVAMRALGTEPFWNAAIDGRCVTYSTPENQAGTRIWTRIGDGPEGPIFTGTYQGKPFVLVVRPSPRCSDGMSDRLYEWRAELTVGGEKRSGCAETR